MQGDEQPELECRVYKRRWAMLALFALVSTVNSMHWIQYSIIANVVMRYYNISSILVNWTSMVYMACYIPLVFPASWVMQKKGLRFTLLCGGVLMTIGAWLKVFSADPGRFYLAFMGQTLVALAQLFILGIPADLAAVWFGPTEVCTACSLGVFGNQVGIALGFLIPPLVVGNHENVEDIGADLQNLYYGMVVGPTIALLLLLIFFQSEPTIPPSKAQAMVRKRVNDSETNVTEHTFMTSLKSLIENKNFLLLLLSYGMNVGTFYAMSTLLNQIVLFHFVGAEEDAGRIGLTIVLAGIVGSVTGGVALDKTHKFKEVTLVVYLMELIGMLTFTFTLNVNQIWVVYLTGALLGFFMTGYVGIGFEFGAELTYPIQGGTSSGMLNASSEVFGIIFILIAGQMLEAYGDLATNVMLCSLLMIGLVITFFINGSDLRRLAATTPKHNSQAQQENVSSVNTSTSTTEV